MPLVFWSTNNETGEDVYGDAETGKIVKVPAGSPPPGSPPPAASPAPTGAPVLANTPDGVAPAGVVPQSEPSVPTSPPMVTGSGAGAAPAGAGVAAPLIKPRPAPPAPRLYDVTTPEAQALATATAGQAPSSVTTPGWNALGMTESGGGQDLNHKVITDENSEYFGMTGAGARGLMPPNAYHLVRDYPELNKKYMDIFTSLLGREYKPGEKMSVEDADKITSIINGNPRLDDDLASRFWLEHVSDTSTKDAQGKETPNLDRAYAKWYGGIKGLAAYDASQAGKDTFTYRTKSGRHELDVDGAYAQGVIEKVLRYKRHLASGATIAESRPMDAPAPPDAEQPEDAAFPDFTPAEWSGEEPAGPHANLVEENPPGAMPSEHLGAPLQTKPPMPQVRGSGGGVIGDIRANLANIKAPTPTVGSVLGLDPRSAINGGLDLAAAVAPPLQKLGASAAYAAKDVINTPLGSRPKIGTAEAEANARGAATAAGPVAPGKVAMVGGTAPVAPEAAAAPEAAPVSPADDLRAQIRAARAVYEKEYGSIPDIDPERLWKNKSTGGKILSAISLALGTFGAGISHTPNGALQIIQQAIADDIDSQKGTAANRAARAAASYKVIESMIDELALDTKAEAAGTAAKAPQFSAMSKLATAKESMDQFARLREKYRALPWGASLRDLKGHAPWASAANDYDTRAATALADIIFSLSGKQSNQREADRLSKMIPLANTWETSARGEQTFDAIQEWIDGKYRALRDAALVSYPGRDFDSLSPAEKRLLSGESEDPNADTNMFSDFESSMGEGD